MMFDWHPTRREFIQASLAAGSALAWSSPRRLRAADPTQASDLVTGKSNQLEILNTSPHVLQTPRPGLQSRITAPEMLFVRNNQNLDGFMTLEPFESGDWSVEFTGLASKSGAISLKELRGMPPTSVEMVLQCSGNGRSRFSEAAQTHGTQWGRGGIGNVTFTGVKLADVLDRLGIEPDASARFVRAQGKDAPPQGEEDFEHSIPIEDVLETALLGLSMNGKLLPRIHGGPVRLIMPGYYATMNVKWLSHLSFEADESTNYNHAVRYRTPNNPIEPGTEYDYTLRNSVPTWKMQLASMVTSHEREQIVMTPRQKITGWAWNDGRAAMDAVLISTDRGETWTPTDLTPQSDPYAWTGFSHELQLKPGTTHVWIRAIDALGRSQPLDGAIAWNPRGYEWNGIEQLRLTYQG